MAIQFGAMIAAAWVLAFILFRNLGLAAGAALVPLSGAGILFVVFGRSSVPILFPSIFAYILGFGIALLFADEYASQVLSDTEGKDPPRYDRLVAMRFVAAISIVGLAAPFFFIVTGSHFVRAALPAMAANLCSILCAWIALPFLFSSVAYGEDFIASTNRLREGRARRIEELTPLAQARWSWSAAGIFVVISVLAVFGGNGLHIVSVSKSALQEAAGLVFFVLFAVAWLATGDWRRGLAICAATAGALLIVRWFFARMGLALDASRLLVVLELTILIFLPLTIWAAASVRYIPDGHDVATAALEAGMQKGPVAAVIAIAPLILFLPWWREAGIDMAEIAVVALFALACVLYFLPALAIVFEALFPRRRDIRERYRIS